MVVFSHYCPKLNLNQMKKIIKDLKKGEKFKFNYTIYTVKQKYSDWKKNDEPYLRTVCGVDNEYRIDFDAIAWKLRENNSNK